jgi:outer membrane protein OmpA-like peptidoglycan-associated protein/tetratricopeptide (TPR) repeat protein
MKTNLLIQRSLFLTIIFIISLQATSQVDQRIAMADKYYKAGDYFTAAGLYEEFLNPPKKEIPKANFPLNTRRYGQGGGGSVDKYDIIYKQAESYRLANYWQEAAEKYKECFEKDFTKYSDAFYWYAVCQRSLGKYAATEEYLNRFLKTTAANDLRKQDAEKELQTIQFIKKQLARSDSVLFQVKKNNTSFGKEKGIFALTAVNNNQFMFTSTVTDAVNNKEENPRHSRLFYAEFRNGILDNIEPVIIQGIDSSFNQGTASISPDKKVLYYTQWKKENGKNVSSIYYSIREGDGWSKPALLSSINKKGSSNKQPFCSADGKTLFFASDREGGSGGFDIWYATIQADGTTGDPINAGQINTKEDEQAPFYHSTSGNLVFSSNGMQGMGGFDLFTAKMNESGFKKPENMGHPVNSSRDDIYFFADEKNELLKNAIIGSDRGSECCLETYTIAKTPKKKMITGIVRDCKTNEVVADAVVTINDKQIKTGADGKFLFELHADIDQQKFSIVKDTYTDKTENANVESINDADLLIDIYNNAPICIEKIVIEEKPLVIKVENVVTLYFDFDKSILKEREKQVLDSIYNVLMEANTTTIQISGYTDGLGTEKYNNKLSDRRAKACADYLIKKGIDKARISFVSFGKCCPVEMELINGRDNPDGRVKNRRALINISKAE